MTHGEPDAPTDVTGAPREVRSPAPSREVGSFLLERELGAGGMGVVHRALPAGGGNAVALKMVRVAHPGLFASIRREIQALSRLGHPGIVSIVDAGVHAGVPWYAMELLEGLPTLRQQLGRGGVGIAPTPVVSPSDATIVSDPDAEPLPPSSAHRPIVGAQPISPGRLAEAVTLVRRLCEPLAYLHGEGLVHRDLKPDNVLVRPGGAPVIVDFGLTVAFASSGREAFQIGGETAGTVAYMSPEQARGELPDARADLYALGCILYELLAGRPPFAGVYMPVLQQHLREEPRPLSAHVSGAPRELQGVLDRLLAKSPRDRFGYATDVAAALAALGAGPSVYPGAPPPRSYLYRPRLAGRGEPLQKLAPYLARLHDGEGGLVLLGGESGVGKTRLAMEIALQARRADIEVLHGGCEPGGGPLHGLLRVLQSIADRCRAEGLATTERVLGRRGKLLARYEPTLRGLPGQESHEEPAELAGEAGRLRLLRSVWETLAASDRPRVIVIEDLQWGDELTLALLDLVARSGELVRHGLLLLGTYRIEEDRDELRKLRDEPRTLTLVVERLQATALGAMVTDMLALDEAPSPLVDFLARESEGNPFHVAAYLRLAVERGMFWRDRGGRWRVGGEAGDLAGASYETLGLPGSIRELLVAQLDRLTVDVRRVAALASLLGRDIDPDLLAEVAGSAIDAALAELVERQLLVDLEEEGLRFLHDKVREVAYATIDEGERAQLHGEVAHVLDALPPERRRARLGALGHHHERAGDRAAAMAAYLEGARHAVTQQANAEATRLYRAYLALETTVTPESIRARFELAEGPLAGSGRLDDARELLWSAYGEAQAMGDRSLEAAAAYRLGVVESLAVRGDEVRRLYELALDIYREIGDRTEEGRVLASFATYHREEGNGPEAEALFETALAIHREVGNREGEGIVLANSALLRQGQGRHREAIAMLEEALAIHREVGNRVAEASGLAGLAIVHGELGHREDEAAIYLQALQVARSVGNKRAECGILGNLAVAHQEAGRFEDALEMGRAALKTTREIGDRRHEAPMIGNLASVTYELGRLAEADALLEQALEAAVAIGDRRYEGWVLGNLIQDAAFGLRPWRPEELARGAALLEQVGDALQLCLFLARAGHVPLSRGSSAAEILARAQALRADLGTELQEAATSVDKLARAQEAFDRGLPLACGYLLEDLQPGERRWILQHPQLVTSDILARIRPDGSVDPAPAP